MTEDLASNRWAWLFKRVDGHSVAVFRIAFGLLVLFDVLKWLRKDIANIVFEIPVTNFTYAFLGFLQPSASTVQLLLWICALCLLLIALGVLFRYASAGFLICFSIFFFSEKALYNNHLYLIFLLALIFIFTDADRVLSLGRGKRSDGTIPAWNLYLLRFMIVLVYFYGGLAKLNADWLVRLEPVRALLDQTAQKYSAAGILNNDLGAYFIAYGGLAFDLAIGFLLLFRKTRWLAIPSLLLFNLTNGLVLFSDISIFPYFMILATVLFFEPSAVKVFLRKAVKLKPYLKRKSDAFPTDRKVLAGLALFVAFQLLFPFRHWLIPGNTDWTAEAQSFSWRMKIQLRRTSEVQFVLRDKSGRYPDYRMLLTRDGTIFTEQFKLAPLTQDQLRLLGKDPRAVHHLAQVLEGRFRQLGQVQDMEIRAKVLAEFNNRPPYPVVDSTVDMLSVGMDPFRHNPWIASEPP